MHRRRILAASGTLAGTALAGCSTLLSLRDELSLTVINRDESNHRVAVALLRRNADEMDRAQVYDREISVSAASPEQPSVEERNDIVESRPYIVRVDVSAVKRRIAPYHFYPDCAGETGPEERLYIDLIPEDDTGLRVEFGQNGC